MVVEKEHVPLKTYITSLSKLNILIKLFLFTFNYFRAPINLTEIEKNTCENFLYNVLNKISTGKILIHFGNKLLPQLMKKKEVYAVL
jgi:hypothetical protein